MDEKPKGGVPCPVCGWLRKRKWRREHREEYLAHATAHRQVAAAERRGDLVRPVACERCGLNGRPLVKHHEDYERPLEVRWLCTRCHGEVHAVEKGGQG